MIFPMVSAVLGALKLPPSRMPINKRPLDKERAMCYHRPSHNSGLLDEILH